MLSIGDAIAAVGLVKEWLKWKEPAPLVVHFNWPEEAKKAGLIATEREYVWARADQVAGYELAKTHERVWIIDKLKRTRQTIVLRDGLTLMARVPKPSGPAV